MYRITHLSTKNQEHIKIGSFSVIVGPNNSGKSQILRDICKHACIRPADAKVLENIKIDLGLDPRQFLENYVNSLRNDDSGRKLFDTTGFIFDDNLNSQYDPAQLQHNLGSDAEAFTHFQQNFSRTQIAYLTTEARLFYSKKQVNLNKNFQSGSASLVECLFYRSDAEEQWLSETTFAAFGLSVVLDRFTNPGALELRVTPDRNPPLLNDRDEARDYMSRCARLDEQGDGIRSFVAALGATNSLERPVILIDEPESFLHPPQAYLLGKAFAEIDINKKQIICATHSADFLRGVLAAQQNVTVLRVSRNSQTQQLRTLNSKQLEDIANDPVLSSGRVLDGIFYNGVVITESDGDAVIYELITSKLDSTAGTYFVNSYSKQATPKILKPYADIGVPYLAIVDLDAIRVAPEFKRLIEAFTIEPEPLIELANTVRQYIDKQPSSLVLKQILEDIKVLPSKLDDIGSNNEEYKIQWLRSRLSDIRADASLWSKLKKKGISSEILDDHHRNILQNLLDSCAELGLFIVPVGEREAWLEPDVPYTRNKNYYTGLAIDYISSDKFRSDAALWIFIQNTQNYLRRRSGDT